LDTSARSAPIAPVATARAYRAIGIALAAAGVVLFSLRPIMVKLAYGYGTDAVTLLALRMIFSLPFFLAVALWGARGKQQAPLSRRDVVAVLQLGFLGYYFASILEFLGLEYLSAGIARLINFLYPTIVVVLSALFLTKPVTGRDVVALALSYCGVALVLSNALAGQNANLPLGTFFEFASATAYAVYLVVGSQVVQRLGSVRFTAYAMTVASLLCIVQFLLLRPPAALDLPAMVYALAVGLAVFSTVVPVFMVSEALKRIGANHVAMFGALGPVTTILFGVLGLDEMMSFLQAVGAVLVLAGVVLVTLEPVKSR
jgi:drug/metabolite transporter (DMT)-like permease